LTKETVAPPQTGKREGCGFCVEIIENCMKKETTKGKERK